VGVDSGTKREGYVAALRFPALNRAFDPLVRVTMRERRFKRELLDQAAIKPGQRVLDLGCGTGMLAILAKERAPDAEVVGLDGDAAILKQARSKAEAVGLEVRFDHGFSTELPYEAASVDRVFATLFFHHLTTDDKRTTLREIARVLRPDGELHIADFTRPSGPMTAIGFGVVRLFDGIERTRINARGELGTLVSDAGLQAVSEYERLRTAFGQLALIRATRDSEPPRLTHRIGEPQPGT
jgi:cyclopropane fatty-acyl-phospholipid synthase-like methyltransferase